MDIKFDHCFTILDHGLFAFELISSLSGHVDIYRFKMLSRES